MKQQKELQKTAEWPNSLIPIYEKPSVIVVKISENQLLTFHEIQ